MTKEELVFNWRTSESHIGFKIIAVSAVAIIFTVLFGLVEITLKPPKAVGFDSASAFRLVNDELGREWTLLAEENGPFPGRLEIAGAHGLADIDQAMVSGDVSGWSGYDVSLRKLQAIVSLPSYSLASKGQRYFPSRVKIFNENVAQDIVATEVTRKAILAPYDDQALKWMPEEVPDFVFPVNGGDLLSASWRFMLSLRPDGSVSDCVSLSGGADAGLKETTDWLRGLRFKSGEGERWLGLRVEFVNN